MFQVPEKYRATDFGPLSTTEAHGNNGVFTFTTNASAKDKRRQRHFMCMAADGTELQGTVLEQIDEMKWDHVSVSIKNWEGKQVMPRWEDMELVRQLFWGPEDFVIQIHPPVSEYVNNHEMCLHLWSRPGLADVINAPHSLLVGIPG